MRLLLDTHALLWWLAGDRRLPRRARGLIADGASKVYVSAASAWEVATKYRLGKLPAGELLASEFVRHVTDQDFLALDITLEHAQRAGSLPGEHRDPFDRMLIAQAQLEGLDLVSNETLFDAYGIARVW